MKKLLLILFITIIGAELFSAQSGPITRRRRASLGVDHAPLAALSVSDEEIQRCPICLNKSTYRLKGSWLTCQNSNGLHGAHAACLALAPSRQCPTCRHNPMLSDATYDAKVRPKIAPIPQAIHYAVNNHHPHHNELGQEQVFDTFGLRYNFSNDASFEHYCRVQQYGMLYLRFLINVVRSVPISFLTMSAISSFGQYLFYGITPTTEACLNYAAIGAFSGDIKSIITEALQHLRRHVNELETQVQDHLERYTLAGNEFRANRLREVSLSFNDSLLGLIRNPDFRKLTFTALPQTSVALVTALGSRLLRFMNGFPAMGFVDKAKAVAKGLLLGSSLSYPIASSAVNVYRFITGS